MARLNADCLNVIAGCSIAAYRRLLHLRSFALRSLRTQLYWQKHFTVVYQRSPDIVIHYLNCCIHRVDGPAIEHFYDELLWERSWWINGRKHRIDGPAVESFCDGMIRERSWWVNGKLHRLDGPAIERYSREIVRNGEWWIDGRYIR